MLEVFRSRKMAAMLILGFSSGLPLFLSQRTLQAWLTTAGVDLSTIGFFSLLGLPYSLKFLWSPLVDRYSFPFLGRRRSWIFASQILLGLTIVAASTARPERDLQFVAVTAFLIALFSATQDIAFNAYQADILEPQETGAGGGLGVLGYRLAMIFTGSAILVVAQHFGWPAAYWLLGLTLLPLLAATVSAPESAPVRPPESLYDAVRMPFAEFFHRKGTLHATLILLFVIVYRLGDSMIVNMTTTFLLQTGFSLSDVGTIQTGIGLVATIGGVLGGGAILSRIGINRSLWIFGALQAASNLSYFMLAQVGRNYAWLTATVIIENVCTGLGTAALFGFLISLCNKRFSATQYALLSSLMAVGRDIIVAPTGVLAKAVGWPEFFFLSFIAALPGLALLPAFAPWNGAASGFTAEAPTDAQI
jgi:PAT family beta-lactamase induction signal transducer AmpG